MAVGDIKSYYLGIDAYFSYWDAGWKLGLSDAG